MNRVLTPIELLVVLVVVVVLIGLCLPFDTGLAWLGQSVGHLLFGWVWYLDRTLPKLAPNPAEFAVAGVALAVLTVGCHRLGRFLAGPGWRAKWTAQAVGLLVLLFACGTAAVGVTHQTAWLVRSPEPLTEQVSRYGEQAAGMNRLRQIGLAAANHESMKKKLPVPSFSPDGRGLHSWHTFLLPYVEQEELSVRIDRSKPWTDPAHRSAVETRVKVFESPVVRHDPPPGPAPTHYAPNARLMDKPRSLSSIPEGASNTILAGEALADPKPWADPLNWRDPRRPLGSPGGFAGRPGQSVLILMADGSVRVVSPAGWEPVLKGQPPGDD